VLLIDSSPVVALMLKNPESAVVDVMLYSSTSPSESLAVTKPKGVPGHPWVKLVSHDAAGC
jgi:hypothetical protein